MRLRASLNAVDKVLGAALNSELPVADKILMVSGRLGFEIAQKALAAGILLWGSPFPHHPVLQSNWRRIFNMMTVGFLRATRLTFIRILTESSILRRMAIKKTSGQLRL